MKINSIRVDCKIDGKDFHFKSKAEHRFAQYLEFMRVRIVSPWVVSWEYEPKTFWFEGIRRGTVAYKPDFRVVDVFGATTWYEVKGFMDKRSATKIKRFAKYFPKEKLIVVDSKWLQANYPKFHGLIEGW